jgi:hypothetical protein
MRGKQIDAPTDYAELSMQMFGVGMVVESVGDIALANCVGPRGNHVFQLAADEFLNLHPRQLPTTKPTGHNLS